MKKVLLLAVFAFALFGCVQQQPTATPTPIPTVVQQASPSPAAQIANPASVNCVDLGGTVDIRTNADGEYGVCVFANGSECDEWKLFRGEPCEATPEPTATPEATPEPTAEPLSVEPRCLVTSVPSEGTTFVHADAIANFYDLTPMPAFAVFSCEYSNETLTVPISNTTARGYCSFHLKNNSLTTGTVTASAGGVSCTSIVTVRPPVFANCTTDYPTCLTVRQSFGRICSLSPNVTDDCGYYEGDSMKCYHCSS